jgi:hypothetical protein
VTVIGTAVVDTVPVVDPTVTVVDRMRGVG